MGVAEAPLYPALIYLLSRWIPENERARVSSIVFCGGQVHTFALIKFCRVLSIELQKGLILRQEYKTR